VAFGRLRNIGGGRSTVEMAPWKVRLAGLGILVFFVGGIAAAVFESSLPRRVVFAACGLLFGAIFLIALPNLFRSERTPLITVTPDGLESRLAGLIRWDEIERVEYTSLAAGVPALGIWTRDPYLCARRGPWWLWPFVTFNRAFGYPAMSFTKRVVPIDELNSEIERNWTSSSTRDDVRLVSSSD
jgi:hypothetical protein